MIASSCRLTCRLLSRPARVTTRVMKSTMTPERNNTFFQPGERVMINPKMIEASSQDKPISHALQASGPHQPLILLIHRR